jgi:DNA end-binding protein Ku
MAPDGGGEKAYALLFEALRKSGYSGVAKIAMHNREHIVILRPGQRGILLHTMYFTNEIRQVDEFRTDLDLVKEKELALAGTLIEALSAKFEPEKYKDTYRENLMGMIQTKIQGQKVVEAPEPHVAPVIDIMEALKRTLEIKKKPVQAASESAGVEEAEAPSKKKRAGGKHSG